MMKLLAWVPWWVWLIALAAIVSGSAYLGYDAGKDGVQRKWDKSVARGKAEIERIKAESGKVTVRVETKYVDRLKTVEGKTNVIYQKIPHYIPAGSCDLPAGWRMLVNAAAQNTVPDTPD